MATLQVRDILVCLPYSSYSKRQRSFCHPSDDSSTVRYGLKPPHPPPRPRCMDAFLRLNNKKSGYEWASYYILALRTTEHSLLEHALTKMLVTKSKISSTSGVLGIEGTSRSVYTCPGNAIAGGWIKLYLLARVMPRWEQEGILQATMSARQQ